MAKMVYQYKGYYFESEDDTVMLYEDAYFKFVEECRKLIQEDREKGRLARQELIGGK